MPPGNSTWTDPVELTLQSGLERTFREPYDALYFLEEEWPTRSGVAYERAKRWCRLAIETDEAADVARKAFIAAARQAGMLAGDGEGRGNSAGGRMAVA
ncbi:unnamed protein product [Ciceribacter sp. T2.26MG-112.2]|uniref:DUF982 domain-containing protein n=1 Tax=Ciceribacter sp. T2.26MG-112.2 TaxID=3137154 RepID=UPI000E1811B4|nr:DUF982 domain-containing protein [Ciceribacter naphthalenivorans]SSC71684.1 unnamed protein product [Ciceribacter naphthalenivorans]